MADQSVTRNYRDNFDFKELTTDVLIPKYFPDQDISTRMSGLLGLTTEQLAVISEDGFNAVSTLLKEFFITKASLPESIYSYAAIFQLSDVQGSAAECTFLLVFSESELSDVFDEANLSATPGNENCIYIGKNTTIYVEDIPFILDYDIEITRKKTKLSSTEYVYGAKYVTTEFTNSISTITNPYIKIRRTVDGFFGLEIRAHQCTRYEETYSIIDNSALNYPVVDVEFSGIIAGFDAWYKAPGDTEWTQMITKVDNSLPEKDPFCYYKIVDENILRLLFSLSDSYFQPEFNSEVKVIVYTTLGEAGNFTTYTGTDVSISKDVESYSYNENFIINAMVHGASSGGKDNIDIEELRTLVTNQFSTANVLSTDNDLELYFNAYENRNNNIINFIKRRDDLASRLYTGYMVCKNEDYVYPTNTLDISMNYTYWNNPDGGYIYTHEPGHLYTYDGNTNRVTPYYKLGFNEVKYIHNFQGQNVAECIVKDYFAWLHEVDPSVNPDYDKDDPDWEENWVYSKEENETLLYYVNNIMYTCENPDCGYHSHKTFINEDGEETCYCCHQKMISKGKTNINDFCCTVFDTDEIEDRIQANDFVYANPFLMSITKHPGLVNYYLTIINQESLLDFTNYNIDTPLQFVMTSAKFERPLAQEKKYTVTVKMMSSMQWNPDLLVPGISKSSYVPRRSQLENNYLRLMMVIMDGGVEACYIEMVPSAYDSENDVITFQCSFIVNDHVTLGNQMQLDEYTPTQLGYTIHLEENEGTEYTMDESEVLKVWVNEREYMDGSESGETEEGSYNETDVSTLDSETSSSSSSNSSSSTTGTTTETEDDEEEEDTSGIHGNFVYVTNSSSKLVPMEDLEIRFVVLTKEYEDPDDCVTNNYPSNELFFNLYNYQWTNIYSTFSDRVDLIKPLTMVRSSMYFRDDRLYNVSYGDIYLYSSPMVKYSLLQHYDSRGELAKNESGVTQFEMFTYMISTFYDQYKHLETVLSSSLCQASYIDLKFYNTYGKSKNYIIGDEDELIDRVNMSIAFCIYLVAGTDILKVQDELKLYIKDSIETLNENGSNDFHISNLMRSIENNFAYVDHLKFVGINGEVSSTGSYALTDEMGYSSDYQSIKNITKDLDELSKEERFAYVPEMLCINKDQICLTFYIEE